jgi:hypothetical protein
MFDLPNHAPRRVPGPRVPPSLAWLLMLVLPAACHPCSGIVACQGDPVFRAGGWIVDHETGKGMAGVEVTFLPDVGASISLPPAVSARDGRWETRVPAAALESLSGRFRVAAPGGIPYETDPVTLRSSTRGGSDEQGRWTSEPYFAFIGELWFPDRRPRAARVRFVRTGGASTNPEQVELRADPFGRFLLQLEPLEAGEVVGDLEVRHSDLPRTFWIRDLRIPHKYRDELLPLDRVLQVGPSLAYLGRLMRRSAGTLVPVEGIETEFRRLGGVPVSPSVVRSVTVDWGGFSMVMTTFEEGEVEGELRAFLPPDGGATVLDTLRLPTFEGPELRSGGEWAWGPQVYYQAGVRDGDSGDPLVGLQVEFVRTGGISAEPGTVQAVTDGEGLFVIALHVEGGGEVEGEIRIHPGGGGGPVIIPGIRLEAREDDDLHFLGWLDV